jgi:RNA polymerase sigma-70 factor (ECF subfamily)
VSRPGTGSRGHTIQPESESTLDLLLRARAGDRNALDRLIEHQRSPLRRWACGRLPRWARIHVDTDDLVQDVLVQTLGRLNTFEPRREGALQAYLRQAILNRIQDEVRRARRAPANASLPDGAQDQGPSPLEEAVGEEVVRRYEAAMNRLRPEDREAIVARVELGLSFERVAEALGKPSVEAAQMAVSRALVRLAREMGHER